MKKIPEEPNYRMNSLRRLTNTDESAWISYPLHGIRSKEEVYRPSTKKKRSTGLMCGKENAIGQGTGHRDISRRDLRKALPILLQTRHRGK